MPFPPQELDEAGHLDDSLLAALPDLGESAVPDNLHAKWAKYGLIKPKAKMRLFASYGMGGFSLSLHDWFQKAPDWLEVRPLELPGHGWRDAEPLAFEPGSKTDPIKFWPPPAFIDSPFAEKREYLQYLQLAPAERQAMLSRYLAARKAPKSVSQSPAPSAPAAPREALSDALPEAACLRLKFLKASTASISLEFVLPSEHPAVACFELQWRLLPNEGGVPPTDWKTASAALAGPTATKGMLKAGLPYAFRARAQLARSECPLPTAETAEPEAPKKWTAWTPSTEPLQTLERKGIDPSPATSPVPPRREGSGESSGAPTGGLPALDTPSAQAALAAAYSAARDALVSSLVDSISALTGAPYALYGFSNGAMIVYLMAIELQRRGLPPPAVILCACRGAPHIVRLRHAELASAVTMSDTATVEWAERAGVIAPASERRGLNLNPRFAPTARSDIPLGLLEAGTRPCEPRAGCGALESSPSDDAAPIYADSPPKLHARLVSLLGSADQMWPSAFGSRWADVAGEGGFQEVCLPGVPHHQLQSHKIMRDAVLREVGQGLAGTVLGSPAS